MAIDEAAEIGQAMRLSEISPDYSGQLPHAELPPRVTGTRKAHDALKNVPKAEVVGDGEEPPKEPQEPPQEPQDAQEGATAEDEPLADEKAKSTVWLTWCDRITAAGVDDIVWAEKKLIEYAAEQGIEYGKMTQKQAEDLADFMAEDSKAVEAWISKAVDA